MKKELFPAKWPGKKELIPADQPEERKELFPAERPGKKELTPSRTPLLPLGSFTCSREERLERNGRHGVAKESWKYATVEGEGAPDPDTRGREGAPDLGIREGRAPICAIGRKGGHSRPA